MDYLKGSGSFRLCDGRIGMKKQKGILLIILSAFCFSLMNLFVRMAGDVPSVQKSFFRNLVSFVVALLLLKKSGFSLRCEKGNLKYLLLRASFGTIGILCNFYAVDHLVLADASMLNKMSPFFAVIFSFFILNEKVKPYQAMAVAGAFVGSLFIIRPTFSNMELVPSLIGLAGGMGAGAAYTMVRLLGERGEKGPRIVCFFSGFSCLVTVPFLLFGYQGIQLWQLGMLLLAGLAATGGQFAITAAYFHAPARELSVYDYSQILFSAILGFFVFGQVPDRWSWVGYLLICGMAVMMYVKGRQEE